jgi:hypothetical protein
MLGIVPHNFSLGNRSSLAGDLIRVSIGGDDFKQAGFIKHSQKSGGVVDEDKFTNSHDLLLVGRWKYSNLPSKVMRLKSRFTMHFISPFYCQAYKKPALDPKSSLNAPTRIYIEKVLQRGT